MILSLKEKYKKEVVPEMIKKFGYKNIFQVPKIEKVVVNAGFGKQVCGKTTQEQKKIQEFILRDLSLITGQKPKITKARKAVSGFKLRKGMIVGAAAVLRKNRMYDFMEKLINIALPRTRDFKGIDEKSFDNKGNLTIAIRENIVFPEISPEKSKITFGFEVTVATTAKRREEGIMLLRLMGFPIKKSHQTRKI